MKVSEVRPHWAMDAEIVISGVNQHYPNRHGMGITFACPHCVLLNPGVMERGGPVQFLGVWFANPIDGEPPTDGAKHLWQRSAETFETLTLSPSVDASES